MAVSSTRLDDGNLSAVNPLESQVLPARITLISHAATLAMRRAAFPLDEPVLEGELEKVAAIGWTAPRAQHVWSGPERRTRQTAEALGLKPERAIEMSDLNCGSWSGKQIEDIQTSDPRGLAAWLTNVQTSPHGGESIIQLIARVESWIEK